MRFFLPAAFQRCGSRAVLELEGVDGVGGADIRAGVCGCPSRVVCGPRLGLAQAGDEAAEVDDISLAASESAMISASQLESATRFCFREPHVSAADCHVTGEERALAKSGPPAPWDVGQGDARS